MKLFIFRFLSIFIVIIKRISSFGKKVKVITPNQRHLAFESQDDFKNTKLLELKKKERVRQGDFESEKSQEENNLESNKKKSGSVFNLNVNILNKICSENKRESEIVIEKPGATIRSSKPKNLEKTEGRVEEEETVRNAEKLSESEREKESPEKNTATSETRDSGYSRQTTPNIDPPTPPPKNNPTPPPLPKNDPTPTPPPKKDPTPTPPSKNDPTPLPKNDPTILTPTKNEPTPIPPKNEPAPTPTPPKKNDPTPNPPPKNEPAPTPTPPKQNDPTPIDKNKYKNIRFG